MRTTTLPTQNMIVAYWLNSELTNTFACPPLRNVLAFTRQDGTPLVNVVNLVGAHFCCGPGNFRPPYIFFEPSLLNTLENGDMGLLQRAGIKVVLTIMGHTDCVQWSSVPKTHANDLAKWLNQDVLQKYGFDGIDIDDEYGIRGSDDKLIAVVKAMDQVFSSSAIISKALYSDTSVISHIKDYLTYGATMGYGNSAFNLKNTARSYHNKGLNWDQILIGVNAGPVSPRDSFTSIATTKDVTAWQPSGGAKRGMMLWSFSQDIQQFTADPQHVMPYVSPNDHAWIESIATAMNVGYKLGTQWGPYIPWGSYLDSVDDIKVIMSAICTTKSGSTNNSTLNITDGTTGDIMNDNGVLRQTDIGPGERDIKNYMGIKAQKGLGVYVPNGSYLLSSTDTKLTLSAICKTKDGGKKNSSLDITALNCYTRLAWVENLDGVLTMMFKYPISEMSIRSGDVLDALQVTNGLYAMPQVGGNGGGEHTFELDADERIVEISGYTGTWFGWNCVAHLSIKTNFGKTYGPFGSMANVTSKTPFSHVANKGEEVFAFYASTINVPLADGKRTDIIASLGVNFGKRRQVRMSEITLNCTINKSPEHVSTNLGDEVVILDMQSEGYFSLDGVGTRIWEMIETPITVREILAAILKAYDVEPATAERDLLAVLGEMAQEGLIEVR